MYRTQLWLLWTLRSLLSFQGVGKKLHTPLLFSAHLDMRPFLSSTVLQNRFAAKRASYNSRSGTAATDASGKDRGAAAVSEAGSVYELYAVVCHRGHLQACPLSLSARCDVALQLADNFPPQPLSNKQQSKRHTAACCGEPSLGQSVVIVHAVHCKAVSLWHDQGIISPSERPAA